MLDLKCLEKPNLRLALPGYPFSHVRNRRKRGIPTKRCLELNWIRQKRIHQNHHGHPGIQEILPQLYRLMIAQIRLARIHLA